MWGVSPHPGRHYPIASYGNSGERAGCKLRRLAQHSGEACRCDGGHNSQAVNGGWLPLRESAVMSLPSIQWKPATSVGWLPPDVGQGHHSALTQWKPATIDRMRIVSTIAPSRLAVVLSKPPWLAACALARVSIACSGVVASLDGGKPRVGRAWLGPALQIQRNLLYGTYCACYCISLRESE